jgi:hypothetical protein
VQARAELLAAKAATSNAEKAARAAREEERQRAWQQQQAANAQRAAEVAADRVKAKQAQVRPVEREEGQTGGVFHTITGCTFMAYQIRNTCSHRLSKAYNAELLSCAKQRDNACSYWEPLCEQWAIACGLFARRRRPS